MKKEYLTKNPEQTKKLGERLAKEILRKKNKKTAFVIGLEGELGSGKTTFLQGFAKGLGIKQKILSPTFVILKNFKITKIKNQKPRTKNLRFENFYHLDCYRIEKPREILALGFKEIISNPENVAAIEWASKIKKILPKNTLILKFEFIDKKRRSIMLRLGND